jgi:hypothetical protein
MLRDLEVLAGDFTCALGSMARIVTGSEISFLGTEKKKLLVSRTAVNRGWNLYNSSRGSSISQPPEQVHSRVFAPRVREHIGTDNLRVTEQRPNQPEAWNIKVILGKMGTPKPGVRPFPSDTLGAVKG